MRSNSNIGMVERSKEFETIVSTTTHVELNLLVRVLSESILNHFARRRLIEKNFIVHYIDSVTVQ